MSSDKKEDTEEEETECNCCTRSIEPTPELCASCRKHTVCDKCRTNGYDYWEWLHIEDPRCDGCKKTLCRDCTFMCTSCWNGPHEGPYMGKIYCDACKPDDIEYVECRYHEWSRCKECRKDVDEYEAACGECQANANYAARHS